VWTRYGARNFQSLCDPSTSSDLWPLILAVLFSSALGGMVFIACVRVDWAGLMVESGG